MSNKQQKKQQYEYKAVVITPSMKNYELEDQLYSTVCAELRDGWEFVTKFVIPACANPNTAKNDVDVEYGYENINNLYNRVVFIIRKEDEEDGE